MHTILPWSIRSPFVQLNFFHLKKESDLLKDWKQTRESASCFFIKTITARYLEPTLAWLWLGAPHQTAFSFVLDSIKFRREKERLSVRFHSDGVPGKLRESQERWDTESEGGVGEKGGKLARCCWVVSLCSKADISPTLSRLTEQTHRKLPPTGHIIHTHAHEKDCKHARHRRLTDLHLHTDMRRAGNSHTAFCWVCDCRAATHLMGLLMLNNKNLIS